MKDNDGLRMLLEVHIAQLRAAVRDMVGMSEPVLSAVCGARESLEQQQDRSSSCDGDDLAPESLATARARIDSCVQSLQALDFVEQRIEHVVNGLQEMEGVVSAAKHDLTSEQCRRLFDELRSSYSMGDERRIFDTVVNTDDTTDTMHFISQEMELF